MIIGTTKEIKNREYRVGLTPHAAAGYISAGHTVFVETRAGEGAGFSDADYIGAGAQILNSPAEVFARADMIIKVKEPQPCEYDFFRNDLIIYTYLHLAPNPALTRALMLSGVKAVAYETITDAAGNLPCLRPMSQIAGRLSVQEGAKYLERSYGGRGVLLGGVPGVPRGDVVIIGGGIAGTYAAKVAVGMDAKVTLLDVNLDRLSYLDDIFGSKITTLYSSDSNIRHAIAQADLVVGAVLIPGKKAPRLIAREHLRLMKKGAVIVDISIDQGGFCETSRMTTHDDPIYIEEGIVHYCVGNMPGAVPNTSTIALSNETFGFGKLIADNGLERAARANPGIADGINTYAGKCTNKSVAESLNIEYQNIYGLI